MTSVSMFMPSFSGGGAERATLTLAAELLRLGVEVEMVVPTTNGTLRDHAFDALPRSSIVDLRTKRVRWSVPALSRYLRSSQPDALIAVPDDTAFYAELARLAARANNTTLVAVIQNTLSLQTKDMGPKRWAVTPALRWTLGQAPLIVAVSEGVRRDVIANLREDIDPIVIHNPIDIEGVSAAAQEPVSHPWLTDSLETIVSAGRLVPQKDFQLLVRAFRSVSALRPRARLIILGEGPLRKELGDLVAELGLAGKVDLPGFVANPWAYMSRSATFAMSSRYEGLPLVLIEALACQVPTVSTDCPSGPAEILENGRFGRLVPVGDDEALASAIVETLTHRPEPVPLAVLKERYSPTAMACKYLAAIESVRGDHG